MKPDSMHVKIYAPFNIYFDGPAESLSATNDTGPFDVLARHKNFITLLRSGKITVRREGQPNYNLTIDRGVLHVKTNEVTVFLDV